MYLINYLLSFSLLGFISALQPLCSSCKFYIPHSKNPDLGLCKIFQDSIYVNNKPRLIKNLAVHCRSDENLCGKSGFLYEPIVESEKIHDDITYKTDHIQKLCCSENNGRGTLDEIEELERDLVDVFQRMRKHNTMRVYKTSKQLYNFIMKNKTK